MAAEKKGHPVSLKKRLNRLSDLKYFTLESVNLGDEDAKQGCPVEIAYTGKWEVWPTDLSGSNRRACCINPETEEFFAFDGKNQYELSGTGETLEDALADLEKRIRIFRRNKSLKILFPWNK